MATRLTDREIEAFAALHSLIYELIPKEGLYCYLPYYVEHSLGVIDGDSDGRRIFLLNHDKVGVEPDHWPEAFVARNQELIDHAINDGRKLGANIYNETRKWEIECPKDGIHIDSKWRGSRAYGEVAEKEKVLDKIEYSSTGWARPVLIYVVQDDPRRVVLVASADYERGVADDFRWVEVHARLDRVFNQHKFWELWDERESNLDMLHKITKKVVDSKSSFAGPKGLHDAIKFVNIAGKEDRRGLAECFGRWCPQANTVREAVLDSLYEGGEDNVWAFNVAKTLFHHGTRDAGPFYPLALCASLALCLKNASSVRVEVGPGGSKPLICGTIGNWEFLKALDKSMSFDRSATDAYKANSWPVSAVVPIRFYAHFTGLVGDLLNKGKMTPKLISIFRDEQMKCVTVRIAGDGALSGTSPYFLFDSGHEDVSAQFTHNLQELIFICEASYRGRPSPMLPYAAVGCCSDYAMGIRAATLLAHDRMVKIRAIHSEVAGELGALDNYTLLPLAEKRDICIPSSPQGFAVQFRICTEGAVKEES